MARINTDRPVTVYGLSSSIDGVVRYVGQTVQPLSVRLKDHINRARAGKKWALCHWIRKHESLGETIQISVIEENAVLHISEIHWIATYRAAGIRLVNATAGGEGIVGLLRTAEHQEKIAKAQRGRKRRPLTDDEKQVLSRILKTRTFSDEHRRRISEKRKAQGISAETQEKMRLGRLNSTLWRSKVGNKLSRKCSA